MSNPACVIEAHDVTIDFGGGAGIFAQTYQVPAGGIIGLIGPSGCGKTTTVRTALGLLRPQQGHIRTFGRDPSTFRSADRERIGYIPQQFVLYPRLTVAENAAFVGALYGMDDHQIKQRTDELLDFVDLKEARNRLGVNLSGGMQRRLMLAGALMHNPDLIFADEPTSGIDPVLRVRFWEFFRTLREQGRTLVVTTQIVSEAIYCDMVAVMRKGRILAVDTPQQLRRRVLGGEIIHLTLKNSDDRERALKVLGRYDVVRQVRTITGAPADLHVVVEDARAWLPEVLNRLENQRPRIVIASAAPLELSYDEIFIALMQAEEEDHG